MSNCWRSRRGTVFSCGFEPGLFSCFGVLLLTTHVLYGEANTNTSVVVQKDAQFDITYLDTVTSENQTIYAFNHTVSKNKTEGVRVSVELLSERPNGPVLFVVRQKQAVLSFQVPLILRGLYQRKYQYTQVGRTLCQPPTLALSEMQFFYVDVSTLSTSGVHYQLRVSRVESFTLQTDKKFTFNATPSQPQFFKYVFPDGEDTVIVKVNSQKNFPCSVMSIQDIQCPVYDLDNNVAFIGMYQTMTKTGAITVQVINLYLVSLHHPQPYFSIKDTLSNPTPHCSFSYAVANVYIMGVLFCLGIFLSFYILTFLVKLKICLSNKRISFALSLSERPLDVVGRCRQESLSSVEEDDYDTLADIDSDKNIVRTKKYLCVSDLARKDKRVLNKKYQIYFWNIATIAVFYALPVIQLVITYQTVVNVTGNQDICYYNFLCAHPLGALSSFNNILSNLGYVMLGLLFLLIVLQRDILHNRALMRNDTPALECGIPKHFGLFYAMGTALMMEGLLSACYHVCPNYTNFQFDTSFMYMIAGLCMLKLYQKRHPDINASAYSAYACLAAVIFFSVLGVVFGKGNTAFWVVFSVIHIVATMLLSTQLYYVGRWRLDSGILRRILYVIYTDCIRQCSGPIGFRGVCVCVHRAAYGLIKRPNDFASYLLAIAICNLLLYFAFYIIMKLRSGERVLFLALVCILFTAVVWGFALFFFFQGLSTWQKTPAESREHNRDCILLSFFDDHDIWHFLSSIAMFGSFLVLLTMDDDLDTIQREKIYVF
uniref:SID1 transmembrane family, member 2 n=1 Tax=Electrophorus electricus TaxID=8005 RepID=A0A4W4ERG1_ELEEL